MKTVLNALIIAFATYSRVPMPVADWSDDNKKYTMCFFPVVGLFVGIIEYLWLYFSGMWGFGALLRGAVGAGIPILITGGIHMDGFMDVSDAMASWQPREKRLEILKDSHVGAFAVIKCVMYVMLEAAALAEINASVILGVIFCFIISRALSALMMTVLKSARTGGMLDGFSKTADVKRVRVFCGIWIFICVLGWALGLGLLCIALVLFAGFVTVYFIYMCRKYFSGITGDLAGFYSQSVELVLLLTLAVGGHFIL